MEPRDRGNYLILKALFVDQGFPRWTVAGDPGG